MGHSADVVVIGAGIGGVSTAFNLTRQGIHNVAVVDPLPPLTLTSDKSTECYRNWWPNRPMVSLMNRSIDLLEEMSLESGDAFGLSRRGYLFVTADPERLDDMVGQSEVTSAYGAGAVRIHPGPSPYGPYSDGIDVLDAAGLERHFPYITEQAVGALHVRRAGWFSAQQLGSWMLDQAKDAGATLIKDRVIGIGTANDRVSRVDLASGSSISTPTVVSAAGPLSVEVARMAGVDLPLFSELHLKVAFRDHLGVIPREAPMIIWSDPQILDWTAEERDGLEELGRQDLLGEMPIFCHGRPEGGSGSPYFLALWEYHRQVVEPVWPLPGDDLYPEAVMRGMTTMVPGLSVYRDRLPESAVDGGYYTKTVENRPLIGPTGPEGLHVVAGFSGFGVMVAAGAGDLAARHISSHIKGGSLPDYADDFLLSRYDRPGYLEKVTGVVSGQL